MLRGVQHDDGVVSECQVWIAEHYEHPNPITGMTKRSGLSPATFAKAAEAKKAIEADEAEAGVLAAAEGGAGTEGNTQDEGNRVQLEGSRANQRSAGKKTTDDESGPHY